MNPETYIIDKSDRKDVIEQTVISAIRQNARAVARTLTTVQCDRISLAHSRVVNAKIALLNAQTDLEQSVVSAFTCI